MTYGLNTRTVGGPIGAGAQFNGGPMARIVPLSVFFLDMDKAAGKGGDDEVMYGYKKRDKARKPKKAQDKSKDRKDAQTGAQDEPAGGSGDGALTPGKGDKGQSTAPAAEGMGISPSRPGAPSKLGATRMQTGSMGTGDIAQYPVPVGPPLRRVSPSGSAKKKKKKRRKSKKKLTQEQREQWAERLGSLCLG